MDAILEITKAFTETRGHQEQICNGNKRKFLNVRAQQESCQFEQAEISQWMQSSKLQEHAEKTRGHQTTYAMEIKGNF